MWWLLQVKRLYEVHEQSEGGTDIALSQLRTSKINDSRSHLLFKSSPAKKHLNLELRKDKEEVEISLE